MLLVGPFTNTMLKIRTVNIKSTEILIDTSSSTPLVSRTRFSYTPQSQHRVVKLSA